MTEPNNAPALSDRDDLLHSRIERVLRNNRPMAHRSYGSGSLSVRTDSSGAKTWYGTWWSAGRRIKRSLGPKRKQGGRDGLSRSQAERELRLAMERERVVVAAGQRRTVQQAADQYVGHLEHVMERKRSTIQDYRGYVRRHLAPFFGERTLDKIDAAWVTGYLKAKADEGLAAKTVQNHLNFLHGVFAFAIKRGWASANPVASIDRPKKSRPANRRIRFLQPVELDALLRAVPDDPLGGVERPLYLAAAMTGLRQGELLGLRWLDVDWVASRVRVADSFTRGAFDSPKSHEGRSVPMADRLAGELERHFQRSAYAAENDLVFCHPHTGHVLRVQAAQTARPGARPSARPGDHLPRAAPHLWHPDGGRGSTAARDPGVDGSLRRQDHRDLCALRARPDARGGVRGAGVRPAYFSARNAAVHAGLTR